MRALRMTAVTWLAGLMVAGVYGPAQADGTDKKEQTERSNEDTRRTTSTKDQPAHTEFTTQAGSAMSVPIYIPPRRGAPDGRVGGGTRGTTNGGLLVSVLAPDHRGLTLNEQPSLYWFVSSGTSFPVELTLMDPRATRPLLETRIPGPIGPGVHRTRLADYGVRLEAGVLYRWSVAVVRDEERRSKDIVAGGAIERIEPEAELRAKLGRTGMCALPALYADASLWYDALAAVSDLIEAAPQDPELKRQRAALLTQIGLPELGN